jgi:hypothetical protein
VAKRKKMNKDKKTTTKASEKGKKRDGEGIENKRKT